MDQQSYRRGRVLPGDATDNTSHVRVISILRAPFRRRGVFRAAGANVVGCSSALWNRWVIIMCSLLVSWFIRYVVGWIAEMFYAYRIYKISKSRKISAFIIAVSCATRLTLPSSTKELTRNQLAFIQLGTAIAEGMRARTAQNMVDLRLKEEATSILTGVVGLLWNAKQS